MMHVISTNWHVPYLALLAKIPDVTWWVLSFRNGMAARDWQPYYRPLPPTVRHLALDHPEWIDRLDWTRFDACVLHSLTDLPLAKRIPCRKILILHNALQTEFRAIPQPEWAGRIQQFQGILQEMQIHPVFISPWKQESWNC